MIERKLLKDLLEYNPKPHNVAEDNTPVCQVYKRLKEKIRQVLEPEEIGIFVNLAKLECLAWMMVRGNDVETRYVDLWLVTKGIASDMIKRLESDKNDGC